MKIDKKSPTHWLALIKFGIVVTIGLVLRPFSTRSKKPTIILYGHKLNGNLKALYDYIQEKHSEKLNTVFLSMDATYLKTLSQHGINTEYACRLRSAKLIANASAVISDHGLHCLALALYYSRIKFIDVWHGIPFKGFDAEDFKTQHKYDQVWVSSDSLANLYVKKYGFDRQVVKVTGYGRADSVRKLIGENERIRRNLGVPAGKKALLFAPTWKQDNNNRSLYPFNTTKDTFLSFLDNICKKTNAVALIRTHLNSDDKKNDSITHKHIIYASAGAYPNTEEILAISDALICDWSSIAFDYLILNRPTFFLDVAPPFKKGFSLDPNLRFGPIVKDLNELSRAIEAYLASPSAYLKDYESKLSEAKKITYGSTLNSIAARAYVTELFQLLD